jgi:hypothetical protein
MGGRLMPWFPAQDGDWYVAILDEPAAMQATVEAIRTAPGLVYSLRIRAVAGAFPQQAEGLAHLRLSFGGLACVVGVGVGGLQRAGCALLVLSRLLVESKLYVFRQFNHPKDWKGQGPTSKSL